MPSHAYRLWLLATTVTLLAAGAGGCGGDDIAADGRCTRQQVRNVLAQASEDNPAVIVDCDLTLSANDVVTKTIIVEGSDGTTVDCAGALLDGSDGTVNAGRDMIEVRSRRTGETYDPATDITIRGCRIVGSVRTWGKGTNGEATAVRATSGDSDHVSAVRAAAPTRIRFENVDIEATRRIPFYVAPGVTEVTLTGSHLHGESISVGVYLDAESAYNRIIGNRIEVVTVDSKPNNPFQDRFREQMAVDASSWNVIAGNWFSALNHGGIYLYRNCGEGGTARHSTPSHNIIADNVFFYNKFDGSKPSVLFGSRDGNRDYCDDDDDKEHGSGVDDRDFARHNIAAGNRIFKLATKSMIRTGGTVNSPNLIVDNVTVTDAEYPIVRPGGCGFFVDAEPRWVPHGADTTLTPDIVPPDPQKAPIDRPARRRCDNGELRPLGAVAVETG